MAKIEHGAANRHLNVIRTLTKKERAGLKWWAQKYVDNGAYCLNHGINVGAPLKT